MTRKIKLIAIIVVMVMQIIDGDCGDGGDGDGDGGGNSDTRGHCCGVVMMVRNTWCSQECLLYQKPWKGLS